MLISRTALALYSCILRSGKSGKTTNILHTVCEDKTTESCDTEDEEAETKANPKGVWVNNIGLATGAAVFGSRLRL